MQHCDNHGPFTEDACPGCGAGHQASPSDVQSAAPPLSLEMTLLRVMFAMERQASAQQVVAERMLQHLHVEQVDLLGELHPGDQELLLAAWKVPALRANLVELVRAAIQPPAKSKAEPPAPLPEGQVPVAVPEHEQKVDMIRPGPPAKPPQAAEPQEEPARVVELVADEPPPPEDPAVAEAERKLAEAQRELEQAKHHQVPAGGG